MTVNFTAAQELHPYTIELIQEAMKECGKWSSVEEVARYCEWRVLNDGGQHLHRDDGGSYDGDSSSTDASELSFGG